VQVPTLPAELHDLHSPVHAVSQHTPSAQWPVAHSELEEHVDPFGFAQSPSCPGDAHV
jgi:hypothetical protein